jgi:hypothetical protein
MKKFKTYKIQTCLWVIKISMSKKICKMFVISKTKSKKKYIG